MRVFIGPKGFATSEGSPTRKGSFRLKKKPHRDEYEHRVKLEQKLGRKLRPSEDTHHQNRNKADNSRSNLRAVQHSRHPKVTFKGKTR